MSLIPLPEEFGNLLSAWFCLSSRLSLARPISGMASDTLSGHSAGDVSLLVWLVGSLVPVSGPRGSGRAAFSPRGFLMRSRL